MSESLPNISVVVVNYNGRHYLGDCFQSLLELDYPKERVEIICVDNGSSDGSVDFLSETFPSVRVVESDTNLGFASGCNTGARAASGEFLAFVNNDARVDRQWLRALLAPIDRTSGAICSAGRILSWDGSEIDFIRGTANFHGMGAQPGHGSPAASLPVTEERLLFGCGGSMLVDRNVYLGSGGFDDDYFAFFEDVDFGWRLWLYGYQVVSAPDAIVYHRIHGTAGSIPDFRLFRLYERNALFTVVKNAGEWNLPRLLASSVLLGVRRGMFRTNVDKQTYEIAASGSEETEVVNRLGLAILSGIDEVVEHLPELLEKRQQVQSRRRRSDAEIFKLFSRPFQPVLGIDSYLKSQAELVRMFGVDEIFPNSEAAKVLVVGEAPSDLIEGWRERALAWARHLAGQFEVTYAGAEALEGSEQFQIVVSNGWSEDIDRLLEYHEVAFVHAGVFATQNLPGAGPLLVADLSGIDPQSSDPWLELAISRADVLTVGGEDHKRAWSARINRSTEQAPALVIVSGPSGLEAVLKICRQPDEVWKARGRRRLGRFTHDVEAVLDDWNRRVAIREATVADTEARLAHARAEMRNLRALHLSITSTLGYRLLQKFHLVVTRLFPRNSWRGAPYWALRRLPGLLRRVRRAGVNRRPKETKWKTPRLVTRFDPISLPHFDRPRASIIIPAHNKSVYTYNCLRSLATTETTESFEVIVVDDASTDDTRAMLEKVAGAKVVGNPANIGFTESCNAGAAAASGEFLVFLNNDVVVLPGWLTALLDTLDRDDKVGLVGAKLIYPNGKLQEAGAIIWDDGTGHNCGRNDSPDLPEYNFVRDVDYCSGACLAIRRSLFERIGGFDTRYSPAYYEDSDLAFAVRERGYRVLYQPDAQVIHFEGISHGTDLATGIKRFQEVNRTKFVEKWARELKSHHPPQTDLLLAQDRRMRRRLLIAEHHVPTYNQDSGSLRMHHILRFLNDMGFAITFIPDDLRPLEPYTTELQQMGIEVLYGNIDPSHYIRERGSYIDLALLTRAHETDKYLPMVRHWAPQAKVIYDTVDLQFLREERRAEVEGNPSVGWAAGQMQKMELGLALSCDVTVVVSEMEKDLLEQKLPGLKIYTIPNVHESVPDRPGFSERKDLLFVGHFLHKPNVDAVEWFVERIFPLIKAAVPGIRFHIVGSHPTKEVMALASEDVVVTGWVEDLSGYLRGCRVSVAPLRYGAGLKGKVGESLSWGLPVVTTSMGVEGSGLQDEINVLVADSPEEFAGKVIRLYQNEDLWRSIAERGAEFIEEHYSPRVVKANLSELIRVTLESRNSVASG